MSSKKVHPLKYSVHTRLREFHLRRLFPRLSTGRLLDVGCGLGYLTETLGKDFITTGMDYDIHALEVNQARGLDMVRGSVAQLPFKEQSFDVILCSEVLEHLPEGVDEKALAEMARLLRPGGRLLITVPSLEGIRAESVLRNLGHDDPAGGEYHYRIGYAWQNIEAMIARTPSLKIIRKRYAMFLFSELFMDILKWVYFKKNKLKEHSDMMEMKDSLLFRTYRFVFPMLHFCFVCEDMLLASIFKGHILVLALERTNAP
jgi:SAM-dependent methyltransferase